MLEKSQFAKLFSCQPFLLYDMPGLKVHRHTYTHAHAHTHTYIHMYAHKHAQGYTAPYKYKIKEYKVLAPPLHKGITHKHIVIYIYTCAHTHIRIKVVKYYATYFLT